MREVALITGSLRSRWKSVAALSATVTLLTMPACAPDESAPSPISRAELERQVAGMYPAKDASTTVTVACDAGLSLDPGATQDCLVKVNKQEAEVRVTVTEVQGDDAKIDGVPLVLADRVAKELLTALMAEGYSIEKVRCPSELTGRVGESITCTATPNTGGGRVLATVTAVRGLHVDFDYKLA